MCQVLLRKVNEAKGTESLMAVAILNRLGGKSLSEKMTLEKYLRKMRGEPCKWLGPIYNGPGVREGRA